MFEVVLGVIAEEALRRLELRHKASFVRIAEALDSLGELGTQSPNVKRLKNTSGIFRKRVGRFRILFTLKDQQIQIWIIAVEKDTNKDYPRWISYISRM